MCKLKLMFCFCKKKKKDSSEIEYYSAIQKIVDDAEKKFRQNNKPKFNVGDRFGEFVVVLEPNVYIPSNYTLYYDEKNIKYIYECLNLRTAEIKDIKEEIIELMVCPNYSYLLEKK